ncbi:MAG TPA: hypothetical protein VFT49_03515 [Candidatus Saccharimonadales bacterium]|nr:hypothetical protein [Candidatus Saccharimonadales bacterium]
MQRLTARKLKTNQLKRFYAAGAIVAVLIIGGVTLALHYHQPKATSGVIASTSPNARPNTASAHPDTTTAQNSYNSSPKSLPVPASSSTTGSLTEGPSGTFVSNHIPNLSGTPAPSQEQSICNTVPGATCYIEFTQGNVVKKLDELTADSTGSVTWNWDVKTAGFTTGNWTVSAVASLNGQTKTTTDSRVMDIQP